MVSLNEEGRRRRGPFGPANYSKKCIQIEVQLYTVITAMNKPEGVQQLKPPSFYPHYPIWKGLRSHGDYIKRR